MTFINGEPVIARILSGRDTMIPRGPIRQHISELLVKHGTNARTPDSVSRHVGLIVIPFLEDLLHSFISHRGRTLAAE